MFIEQVYKGNNVWWRVLITSALTTGIFVMNLVVFLFLSKDDMDKTYDIMKDFSKNVSLFLNLLPFMFFLVLLFFLVHFLHERTILTLTTARKKIDFKRILFSFSLIVLISLISFFISFSNNDSGIVWNFNLLNFSIMLIISLVMLPFQIGFEEYLFRGYLMQQIGFLFKNRWVPLLATSFLFGIFHSANPEVAEMGYGVMIFYIGTGLLLGVMSLMDDGLELALGFHFGNNLIAATLVTSEFSALQTHAIFRYTEVQDSNDILIEMILSILISYPILLFILSKKYGWTNWKEKLTGNLSKNQVNNKF